MNKRYKIMIVLRSGKMHALDILEGESRLEEVGPTALALHRFVFGRGYPGYQPPALTDLLMGGRPDGLSGPVVYSGALAQA